MTPAGEPDFKPANETKRSDRLAIVASSAETLGAHRVRKAYEQVADQLRELIIDGSLELGQRLPNENELARMFGVSRATVREGLRVLVAQNLLRTSNGSGGGTYVTRPTVDHISEFLRGSYSVLTETQDVSLDEFLEARETLEVAAVRLAAVRHSQDDLDRLAETIPEGPLALSSDDQFSYNRDFHRVLAEACGNTLLYIAAQPIFSVLATNLQRTTLGNTYHESINADHRLVLEAVKGGDADAAADEMRRHLHFLRPYYERAWTHSLRSRRKG